MVLLCYILKYWQYGHWAMKTTIDIHDELLRRAKRHARQTGQTLRAVVESGLRMTLERRETAKPRYRWKNLSVGEPGDPNPFEKYTWAEILEMSYDRSSSE